MSIIDTSRMKRFLAPNNPQVMADTTLQEETKIKMTYPAERRTEIEKCLAIEKENVTTLMNSRIVRAAKKLYKLQMRREMNVSFLYEVSDTEAVITILSDKDSPFNAAQIIFNKIKEYEKADEEVKVFKVEECQNN